MDRSFWVLDVGVVFFCLLFFLQLLHHVVYFIIGVNECCSFICVIFVSIVSLFQDSWSICLRIFTIWLQVHKFMMLRSMCKQQKEQFCQLDYQVSLSTRICNKSQITHNTFWILLQDNCNHWKTIIMWMNCSKMWILSCSASWSQRIILRMLTRRIHQWLILTDFELLYLMTMWLSILTRGMCFFLLGYLG